ncbi:MAG TPA: hypothetical protein EYM93_05665 [Methylococcales bacterium]|nr:hypothetical protein [Methylococcaceae bacterium]HIN68740.1 hypothetical protein [Methylococcales bacterium]
MESCTLPEVKSAALIRPSSSTLRWACTPVAGWEKGQVENQVGNIRKWPFTPRAKFDSFAELNT